MARSLLISGQVSLREAAPCTASRQMHPQTYPSRAHRSGPHGMTNRRPPIVSRFCSIATRPPTPATILRSQRRSRPPPHNAHQTIRRRARAARNRVPPRLRTRRQATIRPLPTPMPVSPPKPIATRVPIPTPAPAPTRSSGRGRNPACRKPAARNRRKSSLPTKFL